jgi:hypothetical protein
MAFIAAIATVGSAALGAYGASQQRKAQDKQTEAAMAGFKQYQPYVDSALKGGQNALNAQLESGYYQGPTYAGPNDLQTGTAATMGQYGAGIMNNGFGMMGANANFGSNAQDLYSNAAANAGNISGYAGNFNDIYSQQQGVASNQGNIAGSIQGAAGNFNTLANQQAGVTNQFQGLANQATGTDYLGNANAYASANSQPLVDAALRDDRRTLQENTLTGIDMSASGSGNMNSSRAGIAEAVANRAYDDRRADVTTQVQSDLRQDSLAQQNAQFAQANTALSNVGSSISGTGSQYGNNISALNSASGAFGNQTSTLNSAGAAATGAMGAYGNANSALTQAGDLNGQISSAYNNGLNTMQTGGSMAMNAGGILQGFDQGQMNADRAAFEGNRDFAMNAYTGYNNGILNRAPDNNQPISGDAPASPLAGAIGGAMQGYDFYNQYFGGGQPTSLAPTSSIRPQARPTGGFA